MMWIITGVEDHQPHATVFPQVSKDQLKVSNSNQGVYLILFSVWKAPQCTNQDRGENYCFIYFPHNSVLIHIYSFLIQVSRVSWLPVAYQILCAVGVVAP